MNRVPGGPRAEIEYMFSVLFKLKGPKRVLASKSRKRWPPVRVEGKPGPNPGQLAEPSHKTWAP
eukprot:11170284-Lingulodinium_polyedra.AAC.1